MRPSATWADGARRPQIELAHLSSIRRGRTNAPDLDDLSERSATAPIHFDHRRVNRTPPNNHDSGWSENGESIIVQARHIASIRALPELAPRPHLSSLDPPASTADGPGCSFVCIASDGIETSGDVLVVTEVRGRGSVGGLIVVASDLDSVSL